MPVSIQHTVTWWHHGWMVKSAHGVEIRSVNARHEDVSDTERFHHLEAHTNGRSRLRLSTLLGLRAQVPLHSLEFLLNRVDLAPAFSTVNAVANTL